MLFDPPTYDLRLYCGGWCGNVCVLREAHWDPFSSVPGRSHALYYIILYYIILYFNAPHRATPKDFLQCNFQFLKDIIKVKNNDQICSSF